MRADFLIITLFIFAVSLLFLLFGHMSKRDGDEGTASKHISVGIILIIMDVIFFVVVVNIVQLYE